MRGKGLLQKSHMSISFSRRLNNSSLEKKNSLGGKSQMLTSVCEVSKTKVSSNSVLPKEGSSANYPNPCTQKFLPGS